MGRVIPWLLLILITAPPAWAQSSKHLSLGAGLNFHKYADSDFSSKNPSISLEYRIALNHSGVDGWSWGPKSSISLGKVDTKTDIGGIETHLGRLRTIPILVGIERAYRQGPLRIGASVVAGPSFNHFDVDAAARSAYLTRLGRNLGAVTVKTSVAIKPGVSAWYDLGDWAALHASLSYVVNRPKAEMTVDGVTTSSTWKTDHASFVLGFVVGVF